MKFNTSKCKVLHLGANNPQHTYRLGGESLTCTSAKRHLAAMIDHHMNMSHQCNVVASRANNTLACINHCISCETKKVILPLYSALVRPQLEYCI